MMSRKQHIPQPRQVKIPFSQTLQRAWCGGFLFPSLLMNAFSIYIPIIERFMLNRVRPLVNEITDPELKKRVDAFMLQEGIHAKEHKYSQEFMESTGFKCGRIYHFFDLFITKFLVPITELTAPIVGK